MALRLYFWHRVAKNDEHRQIAEEVLHAWQAAQVARHAGRPGEASGASLKQEKLRGFGDHVCSLRYNNKIRVILVFTTINGVPSAVVTHVLTDHNYHHVDMTSLRKELRTYRHEAADMDSDAEMYADVDTDSAVEFDIDSIKVVRRFQHQFVQLTDEQERLIHIRAPAIVSGVPGGGKTLSAMEVIKRLITQGGGKVLYVSHSEPLVNAMRRNWQAEQSGVEMAEVEFATYQQIMRQQLGESGQLVEKNHFIAWFKEHLKQAGVKQYFKQHTELTAGFGRDQAETVYEEMMVLSACENEEAYLKLGHNATIYNGTLQREWISKTYKKYCDSLPKGAYQIGFISFKYTRQYMAIVGDECQVLPRTALAHLFDLSGGNVYYFLDTNQGQLLLSNLVYLREMMNRRGVKPYEQVLTTTYRSLPAVVAVANIILKIGNVLHGGVFEKGNYLRVGVEVDQVTGQGYAYYSEDINLVKARVRGVGVMVITRPELVEEAKQLFNTELVYSENALGLEYDHVVCYRLLEGEALRRVNQLLRDVDLQGHTHQPKDKSDKLRKKDIRAISQFYIAVTRAKQGIIIYENPPNDRMQRHQNRILEAMQGCFSDYPYLEHSRGVADTPAAWESLCERLIDSGDPDQLDMARNIYVKRLRNTIEAFEMLRISILSSQVSSAAPSVPGQAAQAVTTTVTTVASSALRLMPISAQSSMPTKEKPKRHRSATSGHVSNGSAAEPEWKISAKSKSLDDYCDRLMNRFTAGSIKLLLTNKAAGKILFDTMTSSGKALIEDIMSDEAKWVLFKNVLMSDMSFHEKLYARLCDFYGPNGRSALSYIALKISSKVIIQTFLSRHPAIYRHICDQMISASGIDQKHLYDKYCPLFNSYHGLTQFAIQFFRHNNVDHNIFSSAVRLISKVTEALQGVDEFSEDDFVELGAHPWLDEILFDINVMGDAIVHDDSLMDAHALAINLNGPLKSCLRFITESRYRSGNQEDCEFDQARNNVRRSLVVGLVGELNKFISYRKAPLAFAMLCRHIDTFGDTIIRVTIITILGRYSQEHFVDFMLASPSIDRYRNMRDLSAYRCLNESTRGKEVVSWLFQIYPSLQDLLSSRARVELEPHVQRGDDAPASTASTAGPRLFDAADPLDRQHEAPRSTTQSKR